MTRRPGDGLKAPFVEKRGHPFNRAFPRASAGITGSKRQRRGCTTFSKRVELRLQGAHERELLRVSSILRPASVGDAHERQGLRVVGELEGLRGLEQTRRDGLGFEGPSDSRALFFDLRDPVDAAQEFEATVRVEPDAVVAAEPLRGGQAGRAHGEDAVLARADFGVGHRAPAGRNGIDGIDRSSPSAASNTLR